MKKIKYYATIHNDKIDGKGQSLVSGEGYFSVEISEEIYNDIERYIWNGSEIVINPNYEEEQAEKERQRLNQLSLTKREVFLALFHDKGITPEQLRGQIQDTEALIEFDYAEKYFRGNPLINDIGALLGYSTYDLDYLFLNKEFPKGE